MLSTTQAAPRGCDSSVPSLPRSARLTAQLQPPFLSCTATSWPGGHKNLHALPLSSGGSAGLASSTAPKHFCSHCGGLCILSCRNPSNTAGRGGGERTNRSRGVLAASAAWFGLVSAAWPLPLPRVLPLGDPPFLLTASPATRPPPLPLLPPPSLLLSLRRVRAHTSGCRPRLQRQTPRRCHLLRQPRPGHTPGHRGAACVHPTALPGASGGGSSFVPSSSSSPGARCCAARWFCVSAHSTLQALQDAPSCPAASRLLAHPLGLAEPGSELLQLPFSPGNFQTSGTCCQQPPRWLLLTQGSAAGP